MPNTKKEIRITRMDPELYSKIDELAKANKRTIGKEAEYQLSVLLKPTKQ